MNRLNKKAVSAVVATVLIIMITVAAVGIIWAAIIPMVRDSLSKGTICNDALSDISIGATGYTCLNVTNKSINLQIKKSSNDKVHLAAVNVLVFTGGSSQSVRVNSSLPGNNEDKMIVLSGTSPDFYSNATSVKIAPVVTVGNTEEICAATQEVILGPCKS